MIFMKLWGYQKYYPERFIVTFSQELKFGVVYLLDENNAKDKEYCAVE